MDEKEYEHSEYEFDVWSGWYGRLGIAFFSNSKTYGREQGTWTVQGIPAGGFCVYPIRWLDETVRLKEEFADLPKD